MQVLRIVFVLEVLTALLTGLARVNPPDPLSINRLDLVQNLELTIATKTLRFRFWLPRHRFRLGMPMVDL